MARTKIGIAAAFVLLAFTSVALAAVEVPEAYWIDGRTSPAAGGITGSAPWDAGFSLNWEITFDDDTKLYEYTYTIQAPTKNISHWILQLTHFDSKGRDLTSYWQAVMAEWGGLIGTWETTDPSNPGLPDDIFGVKFDLNPSSLSHEVNFKTFNEPVWGDFYAKDGQVVEKDGKTTLKWDVYAYNTGIAADPVPPDVNNPEDLPAYEAYVQNYIARPDGLGSLGEIPEPASLLIWGGVAGLGAAATIRRKRRNRWDEQSREAVLAIIESGRRA